jgi:hypothetical protein
MKMARIRKTMTALSVHYTPTLHPIPQRIGDLAVLGFIIVQFLDGALTYLGLHLFGPSIEANPLVSSAVDFAGIGLGLVAIKLVAIGMGMLLHLQGVHRAVALLTAFYLAVAILPWILLFATL